MSISEDASSEFGMIKQILSAGFEDASVSSIFSKLAIFFEEGP